MMSGPVFLLPPLKDIHRFFVRLDADSHITRPVTRQSDALVAAAEGERQYVFWSVAVESCRCETLSLLFLSIHSFFWDFDMHLQWMLLSGGLVTTAVTCMILRARIYLLRVPISMLRCTPCSGARFAPSFYMKRLSITRSRCCCGQV